ncbi:GNAT family N-acetyltransferase [Dongia sp.]|uniref:GNAT family N-acetyltransferase n=1 Tax=Dongia sp. TaxID=1977262 RepID=UPI0035B0E310
MSTTSSSGFSVALDTLIGFCAAHPVADTDAPRVLTRLNSGPDAIIDWRERGVVAVLLDSVTGTNGAIPVEVVGAIGGAMSATLAADLLTEIDLRMESLNVKGVELAITEPWEPHQNIARQRGYVLAYHDCDMVCRDAAWGPDRPIPASAEWRDAWPEHVEEYIAVLHSGFSDTPGAFIPSADEVRRYLQQSGIRARILIENGRGIGLLRYTEPRAYINAVVRAGSERGRGIGQLIMDEARRQLGDKKPMRLTVVDTNTAAIELYRRCNFVVERRLPVLSRNRPA